MPKNESSPPDKKRPRRTPGPEQQQPQLPPQQLQQPQQQPMQPSGAPFQHPLSQGGPGGQGAPQMGNVMRNPMLGFPGQSMHQMSQNPAMTMSMGANMSGPHMGNAMGSGMMGHPPPPNGLPMSQMPVRNVRFLRTWVTGPWTDSRCPRCVRHNTGMQCIRHTRTSCPPGSTTYCRRVRGPLLRTRMDNSQVGRRDTVVTG